MNPPGMSKKQAEFFAILILICTVTAAAILVIDFQIKGAILEESNRMRKAIEGWQNGQRPAAANGHRPSGDTSNDPSYPSDLVGGGATGVEKAGSHAESNGAAPARNPGRSKRVRPDDSGSVPEGN